MTTPGNATAVTPAPTALEAALSPAIDTVLSRGGAGYRWADVDGILKAELEPPSISVRVKVAPKASRAANVLKEHKAHYDLVFVAVVHPYSIDQMATIAREDAKDLPHVRAVAIADRSGGSWRVRKLIARDRTTLLAKLESVFPAAGATEIVQPASQSTPISPATADPESLRGLRSAFDAFLASANVRFDESMKVDLLASALGSQMLLFAGPSGTGKSTAARALASFFAVPTARAVIDARRQLIGPEDLVGYFSGIAGKYLATPELSRMFPLAATGGASPIVVVEEANLSPLEGYLSPLVHGLSSVSTPVVNWALHSVDDVVEAMDGTEVPQEITLAPFPRLFCTINVDSTASAPARKVAARACAILFEPAPALSPEEIRASLAVFDNGSRSLPSSGPARAFLGDPAAALMDASTDQAMLIEALLVLLGALQGSSGPNLVSTRDIHRCLAYMAFYVMLVPASADLASHKLAAENAVLHFVLPSLPPDAFGASIVRLSESGLLLEPGDQARLGSLLRPRVERLAGVMSGVLGLSGAADFWAALS